MSEQPYAVSQRAKRARPTGATNPSRRQMSPGRRVWYALIIGLARGVLALLTATCRIGPVRGEEHLDRLQAEGVAGIFSYWHQMQIFCAGYLLQRARQGTRIAFLTSPSVSGEVPAAIIQRWGAEVLRGSSQRSAGLAMKEMYQVLVGQKTILVVTPDGPKGPLHAFKTGTVMLARMTKTPIVLMAFAARPCIRWNSWDRFILPLPFARVAIAIDAPFYVPAGSGTEALEQVRLELEARMARLVAGVEGEVAPGARRQVV